MKPVRTSDHSDREKTPSSQGDSTPADLTGGPGERTALPPVKVGSKCARGSACVRVCADWFKIHPWCFFHFERCFLKCLVDIADIASVTVCCWIVVVG